MKEGAKQVAWQQYQLCNYFHGPNVVQLQGTAFFFIASGKQNALSAAAPDGICVPVYSWASSSFVERGSQLINTCVNLLFVHAATQVKQQVKHFWLEKKEDICDIFSKNDAQI